MYILYLYENGKCNKREYSLISFFYSGGKMFEKGLEMRGYLISC